MIFTLNSATQTRRYVYSLLYRDLTSREEVWQNQAHEGIVKGLSWTKDRKLISCASDKSIKVFDPYNTSSGTPPLATYLGNTAFTGVSHHRSLPNFAASSNVISVYDLSRSSTTPLQTLHWPTSDNTINALSFNQIETSIIASCATDRSMILFDLRTSSPLSKTILSMSSNAISWNPMEAFNFCVANVSNGSSQAPSSIIFKHGLKIGNYIAIRQTLNLIPEIKKQRTDSIIHRKTTTCTSSTCER